MFSKSNVVNQDLLIYDVEYLIWRDNQYLGVAKWVDDEINGECFIRQHEENDRILNKVFLNIDKWKLK
jgi:hypothetical protein